MAPAPDPLAALKAMLNSGAQAGVPQAPQAPQVPQINQAASRVLQAATPPPPSPSVALAKQKRSTTMSMLMISTGIMICVYLYYKYYAPKMPASTVPSGRAAPPPVPVKRPQRTVHFSADDPEPRSTSPRPRVEEIFDDDDTAELQRRGGARKPAAAAAPPPAQERKPASKPPPTPAKPDPVPEDADPNFRPIGAATEPEDPSL